MENLTINTEKGNVVLAYSKSSNQWELWSGSQEAIKFVENIAINDLGWVYDPKKKNFLWDFVAENVDQISQSKKQEKSVKEMWTDAGKSEKWQEENLDTEKLLLEDLRKAAKENKLMHLTFTDATQLEGKRIQTIYFGYKGQDGVKDFIVGDVVTEFDLAKKDTSIDGFANRAEYWKSYMSEEQLSEKKNRMTILDFQGKQTHIFTSPGEELFHCSDADRYVQYRVVS